MNAEPRAATLLGRIVNVRPAETAGVIAAFAFNFLLFTAYYILRPLRDSMGVTGGVHALDDLFWFTFLGMLLAVPLFGWISGRYRRSVFLPWTYGFFIVNLLAFWAVFNALEDDSLPARVFFVWVSVFNLFVVSVFWSFMADLFNKEQAGRMFAFIAGGASTGAITGSGLTAFFAKAVGDINLLLVSAMMLGATLFLMRYLLRWSVGRAGEGDRIAEHPIGGNPFAGITLVLRSGYLAGIALFVFLMAAVTTFLYLQQAVLLEIHFPDSSERTAFLGKIDLVVSLIALLLQLLAVGRLTARLGVTAMLISVPVIVAAGFLLIAASPTLATLVAVYVVRRVGQYAVTRPSLHILYTTVDRASKYKAKNFNDTVVYRGSDAVVASFHEAVVKLLSLGLAGIAWLGAGVAVVWAVVAIYLGRAHERTAPARQAV
jgi:AAA family ATP:ADP antiporter